MLRSAAALALALAAAACSRPPADPVAAVLASLKQAAESRDAEGLGRQLSPDFTGAQGRSRGDTLAEAKRYLAAYESVRIEIADLEATRSADSAHLRCLVGFSGRPRRMLGLDTLLPPQAAYRFDLDLVRGGEGWLVRHATWEPASASPASQ
ncbi:MAG TPA: hypothetical protein VMX54_05880 [Vicinamibacteria bacterium]|nr:hypothetical protein [Vicinamibacteria bacterium]